MFVHLPVWAQPECVKHWSYNKTQIIELDKLYSSLPLHPNDSLWCDSFSLNSPFNHRWYCEFYNKQIGNYFSTPKEVSFVNFKLKEKADAPVRGIHIVEFLLFPKDAKRFRLRYGITSEKSKIYRIAVLTHYRYVLKGDALYFISTESGTEGLTPNSVFENIYKQILNQ